MAFHKEDPIYLQIRRSVLEHIGIVINDPFDYMQIVPFVTGFINSARDHYFKPCTEKSMDYYDYTNPNCSGSQSVRLHYELDELIVGAATPYAPVLYSGNKALLAGSQEFTGFEVNLGCFATGTVPLDPSNFNMIFRLASIKDPITNKYLVYDMVGPKPHPVVAQVDNPPGYQAIGFLPDEDIDPVTNPASKATGNYVFKLYPEIEIVLVTP